MTTQYGPYKMGSVEPVLTDVKPKNRDYDEFKGSEPFPSHMIRWDGCVSILVWLAIGSSSGLLVIVSTVSLSTL